MDTPFSHELCLLKPHVVVALVVCSLFLVSVLFCLVRICILLQDARFLPLISLSLSFSLPPSLFDIYFTVSMYRGGSRVYTTGASISDAKGKCILGAQRNKSEFTYW